MEFIDLRNASCFKIIDGFWRCKQSINKRPLHRLFSLMRKMGAKTLVKIEIDKCDESITRELSALQRYFGDQLTELTAVRLTFLAEFIQSEEELFSLTKKQRETNALSDSILINYRLPRKGWRSYIFKTIITTPFLGVEKKKKISLLNNYLHCRKEFEFSLTGHRIKKIIKFKLHGSFFCQQNIVTSQCYHAATCMTLNNYINADYNFQPEDINQALNIDHIKKKCADEIIKPEQLVAALVKIGIDCRLIDFRKCKNSAYSEVLYRYLESSEPSLLIFSTKKNDPWHIVPVLGHTLNSDLWHPEAERFYTNKIGQVKYRSTSAWVDHFIIHDDNFGMFQCLPVDLLNKNQGKSNNKSKNKEFCAANGIVLRPKGVTTRADCAEWANITMLETIWEHFKANCSLDIKDHYWLGKIFESLKMRNHQVPIVARTLLATKTDYLASLENLDSFGECFSPDDKGLLTGCLPDLFWLTELSLPDLYTTNKTKLVDLFYRIDFPESDHDKIDELPKYWLQARLPGVYIKWNLQGKDLISETKSVGVLGHYPIMRSKDRSELYVSSEW